MGYVAPIDAIDVSNSNTPGAIDPTNPVGNNTYRAVATVDSNGQFIFTETNAYSGNNGRAAILNNTDGANVFYTAGNAGNGSNPQPTASSSVRARRFIRPQLHRRASRLLSRRPRSPASPSPNSATRQTRSARTTTSAA